MPERTYIFAGGGTGGHLFPGIAVAQELRNREPDCRILFVGSGREIERTIMSQTSFEHLALPVEPLQILKRNPFRFGWNNWKACRAAKKLIRERQPCVVIGLGGYPSFPLVWMASRLQVPIVLLEQNVIPGRVTRWMSRFAHTICTTFPATQSYVPNAKRVVCTGNPVRPEIAELLTAPPIRSSPREILILGGSQGAESLNDAVSEAIRLLAPELTGWRIVHQTGPRHCEAIRDAYAKYDIQSQVEAFFEDIPERYRKATLVISRAGATTLSELTCAGSPMILLPYPHAADDHQTANALEFEVYRAAIVIPHQMSRQSTATELVKHMRRLMTSESECEELGYAAREMARPEASKVVADCIQSPCEE